MGNGRYGPVWPFAHVGARLALALMGSPARAADDPPSNHAASVVLRVDAIGPDQRVDVDVVQGKIRDTLPVAECSQACTNLVAPGLYRVRLRMTDGRALDTTFVRVEDSIALHVVQRDPTLRGVGIGLTVSGPVLLLTALISFATAVAVEYGSACTGSGCNLADALFVYSAIAAPLALVTTPTGLAMLIASDYHVRRESIAAPAPSAAMPLVHVGVVPVPGGATAGFTLMF